MSSCKPLSSKISFGNTFHGSTSDCAKGHFLLFLLNLAPPTFSWCLLTLLQEDISKNWPLPTLWTPRSSFFQLLFLFCLGFWVVIPPPPPFYWEKLEKGMKDGQLILFGGIFCFLLLHMHVYFCLFLKCPNPVYKDLTSVIVGPWQWFITTSKLLFFTYQTAAGRN